MSFIISKTNPFISAKLTQKGRELLSKGQLTFSNWAIGDSEINYSREFLKDSFPNDVDLSKDAKILRPKDSQPNLKYFIGGSNSTYLQPINNSNLKTIELTVNNEATERGFFTNTGSGFTTNISNNYIKFSTTIQSDDLDGSKILNVLNSGFTVGDLVLIKVGVDTYLNNEPNPILWFKIQSINGYNLTLDRNLPNFTFSVETLVMIYSGGEVYNGFGSGTTTAYWDTGTLSFDSSCDITREDVPVWNMNSIFMEGIAGMTGSTYQNYSKFGSQDYLGEVDYYLEYNNNLSLSGSSFVSNCDSNVNFGILDPFKKSISLLHYTNNTISNLYGEFFHIDNSQNKTVKVHLPNLMYHRREFSGGTGTGNIMGMSFIASGETQLVGNSEIEFVDLIEDPNLLITREPKVVGKVFPQLKMVVFDDSEIVAATSYKSNRNWTLPELSINLANPTGGTSNGLLNKDETIYVTYLLGGGLSGLNSSLHCQSYVKVTNNNSNPKDIEFRISDTDLLPYMRKMETQGNSGFNAYKFKIIYQIVTNNDRPNPNNWKVADYTSSNITNITGQSIDPNLLENQNSYFNNQVINNVVNSAATQYDITTFLSMTPEVNTNILQFGDERFFYGNVEAFIGAKIFKTLFDIRIDSGLFNNTTNPTRNSDSITNPPLIKVSEVGVYDNSNNLVIIGKISKPIKLVPGQTIMIEMSIDF
jgi:hypothetical protein